MSDPKTLLRRPTVTVWDRLARVAAERCGAAGARIVVLGRTPYALGTYDPASRLDTATRTSRVPLPGRRAELLVAEPTGELDELDDVASWIEEELASIGVRDFDLRERALQSVSEGIVVADALAPDLPVIYVNRAFEELTGYSAAEVLGRNCRFLQGEATNRETLDILRKALKEQTPCRIELLNYRKDGRPFWNELSIAPVRDGMGVCTHFVGVQKDVTEQRYTLRALRDSEERYATLFDNSAIGIYRSTTDGRLILANRAAAEILGYDSVEDLMRENFERERPHATYPREHFRRVLERDGLITKLEAPWLKKDGSLVFVRESVRAVRDDDARVLYYEGTIEEVEPPHSPDSAPPPSLIAAAATKRTEGVMAIDNSGRIVTFNREFVDLWRIPADLLVGRHDELIMTFMLDQLSNPIEFLFDSDAGVPVRQFAMRDGRVIERTSQRQFVHEEEAGWVWSFRDVTERSQAEMQLRESSERLDVVVRNAPVALFALDRAGIVTLADGKALARIGLTTEEVLGRSVSEIYPGQPEIEATLGRALAGEVFSTTLHIAGFAFDVAFSPLMRGDDMTGVIGVASDVTDRETAARELNKSARERQVMMDTVPDVIFTLGADGRIADWNREFEEVLLGKRDLPRDASVLSLFPPRSRPSIVQLFDFALNGEAAAVDCVIESDGEPLIYEWLAARLPGDTREGTGLICTGRNVTERKRAEAALAEAASTWRRTFDSIGFPVLVVSREGGIRRANETARALLDISFDQLIGSDLGALARKEPWLTAVRLVERTLRDGGEATVQARGDGKVWDVTVSVFGVTDKRRDAKGPPSSAMIVARDITRMNELQESLRRSELLSAMGSLVGGVAHEVRNPLFGISATLDAFEAEFGGSTEIAEYLETFRHDVSRMKRLMNELLEYGKPYALDLRAHGVRAIVDETVRVCAPLAQRKNIGIDAVVPDGRLTLRVDRDRIVQVLKNVVENAIEFAPASSSVTISVDVQRMPDRSLVVFDVRDRGPGFAAKDIPRLFEPFFTRRGGGTGLGLALVQRIVEEHGGSVSAANADGGGAVVTIRLPEGA